MYCEKNVFIDFPVKGYIHGTNIREVFIRKPLSKPMRFLRKLIIGQTIVKMLIILYCSIHIAIMLNTARK